MLVALRHDGVLHDFNFTRVWDPPRQMSRCEIGPVSLRWIVTVENARVRVAIDFQCPRSHMLLMNYEDPDGGRPLRELWNGGHASGTLTLTHKSTGQVEVLEGSFGGCEFGER